MKMRANWSFRIAALAAALIMGVGFPQAQSDMGKQNQFQLAGINGSVKGNGTVNHVSKWVGDGQIGDSAIVEADGKVTITGSVPLTPFPNVVGVLNVQNATKEGIAMYVKAAGGQSSWGVIADGGDDPEDPGSGILGRGGNATNSNGGIGGIGVDGMGGEGSGLGVFAFGGGGKGAGNRGGIGILAHGGRGIDGAALGLAGVFAGDVEVFGTLSAGTKNFKIDHPLDPENKYLYHTSVESPDMMNIYNGNLTTDENGEATVRLPAYFEALNGDFRYQLTVIGTFAQAIVADEINGNRFVIRTSAPNVKVSWQVTGIRRDAWANKNRITVEVEKSERERGSYLHPEAFDQPKERGVNSAIDHMIMRRLKVAREMKEKNHR